MRDWGSVFRGWRAMKTKEHNWWIPKLQARIRELEKQLKRCSQEVMFQEVV